MLGQTQRWASLAMCSTNWLQTCNIPRLSIRRNSDHCLEEPLAQVWLFSQYTVECVLSPRKSKNWRLIGLKWPGDVVKPRSSRFIQSEPGFVGILKTSKWDWWQKTAVQFDWESQGSLCHRWDHAPRPKLRPTLCVCLGYTHSHPNRWRRPRVSTHRQYPNRPQGGDTMSQVPLGISFWTLPVFLFKAFFLTVF